MLRILLTSVFAFAVTIGAMPFTARYTHGQTFVDGTFAPGDWQMQTFSGGFGGTITATRLTSGGNPGPFYSINNDLNGGGPSVLYGHYHKTPGTLGDLGPIDSIDFVVEHRGINTRGLGQRVGLSITQDGKTYRSIGCLTSSSSAWGSCTQNGITADQLFEQLAGGGANSNSHPDFSAAGGAMAFGFYSANSNPNTGNSPPNIIGYDNWQVTINETEPLIVPFDIKPGSDPNSVNLKSKGVLPVAVLSTDDFDVSDIDVSTLLFGDPSLLDENGTAASPLRYAFEDVSDDGLLDLTLKFSMRDLVGYDALGPETIEGLLTGELFDGTPIEGFDTIRIVPPNGSNGNNGSSESVVLASAIPEPSSLLLAALGLLGVGLNRRRPC